MQEPTKAMREEAASGGFYHSEHWNRDYPRLQLLTVGALLAGAKIDYPPGEMLTFKKAPKASAGIETEALPLGDDAS
jgi:site-specific DNA-methyltransferase (adenine-specific)